jgi:tetratricopeptide (TPR) repeat protein/predicted Ser/Thr protein kinase
MVEGIPFSSARSSSSEFQATQLILQSGTLLAQRYEIQQMLGEGGMGAVYKARDRELNRLVAIKVIRPEFAGNQSIIQRFKQELILARQVTHKNVIRIYDMGESEGMKFITMEYVDGEDLRALIRQHGKLTPDEAVEIMQQVCRALESAHSEGVIHRDLKPQNVMRDKQGRIIVMDFGLARSLELDGMTQTGALIGTMEYMSPEQAMGKELDQRSDLFTLGLIFYELLTGNLPFKAETAIASLLRRTRERAVPISQLNREVPQVLSNIVSKCLERDPKQRYQNVQEILNDLDAWKQNKRVSVTSAGMMMARVREIPWTQAALAGLILAIVAVGTWYWTRTPAKPQSGPAPVSVLVSDFQNTTSDSVFDGTLEPAFAVALEGASFISAYNRGQAHRVASQLKPGATTVDESLARLVAVREGVGVVVSGSIASDGNGYRITSRAVDAVSGKPISERSIHVSSKDEVLSSVGKLAARIRQGLGDRTSESVQMVQVETYSSGSLEAAHEYAVAQELQSMGKWEDSVSHYQKALDLDPNMGRAYAGLAAANANMGRRQEAEKYYQMAMARIDRMTDREKYRTRGGYFLMVREPREAIQEYTSLVNHYSADLAGYSNMALAYFYMRNMPKALQEGRRAVDTFPKFLLQRNNLALYAIYAGDFAEGEKQARLVLEQNPAYANAYAALAMAETGQGKIAEATESYAKLESLSPRGSSMAKMGLADLALYQGRVDEAIPLLESGIAADITNKDEGAAAQKQVALAQAYLMTAKTAQALASADKAVQLDKGESNLHAAGVVYAEAGRAAKAEVLVSQLKSRVEPEPQLYGKLLEAEILLKKGNAKEAIPLLKDAQQTSDTWIGRFELGLAYLETSSFPEADAAFEDCLKRRGEAVAVYLDDVPTLRVLPPSYYYLGRVQEGLKSPAAMESYRTFVSLQPQGNTVLLEDAKRRLAKP